MAAHNELGKWGEDTAAEFLQRLEAVAAPLADAVIIRRLRAGIKPALGFDICQNAAGNRFIAAHLRAQEGINSRLVGLRHRGNAQERNRHAQRQKPADQSFLHTFLLYKSHHLSRYNAIIIPF